MIQSAKAPRVLIPATAYHSEHRNIPGTASTIGLLYLRRFLRGFGHHTRHWCYYLRYVDSLASALSLQYFTSFCKHPLPRIKDTYAVYSSYVVTAAIVYFRLFYAIHVSYRPEVFGIAVQS